MGPTTPWCKHHGLGCSAFARRYWRNHCCFLFLWVLRWFTSPRCLHSTYGFSGGSFGINQRGFPHSEIPGSKLVCSLPGLIAAYRVLHRLLVPRHSPYTLSSLTIRNSNLRLTFSLLVARLSLLDRNRAASGEARVAICATRQLHAHCECVCARKKLPFAEYSVVKDPTSALCASVGKPPWRLAKTCWPANRSSEGAKVGGEYRARTGDLLVANQAL